MIFGSDLTDEEYARLHHEIFGTCYLCGTWLEQHPPDNCPEELRLCCGCNDLVSLIALEEVSLQQVLDGEFSEVFSTLESVKVNKVYKYIIELNQKTNNVLKHGGKVNGLYEQTVRHNARICQKYGWL